MDNTQSKKNERKKIWQLNGAYHCSVIGSCMSRADLKVFAGRRDFKIDKNANPYTVHNRLSHEATNRANLARVLHKYLDKKHFLSIKRYSSLVDDESIEKQWQEDVLEGDAAGAYWAIMTHGAVSETLLGKIYGDCHMLSFDGFSGARKEHKVISSLRTTTKRLNGNLEKEQNKRKAQQEEIKKYKDTIKILQANVRELEKENGVLQKRDEASGNNRHNHDEGLLNKLSLLQAENEKLKLQSAQMFSDQNKMKDIVVSLNDEVRERKDEITLLEEIIVNQVNVEKSCSNCDDLLTDKCKGPDLCGQKVLYVGGLHKMISHYRQLVEGQGGVFLHHDGGKEDSRQQLEKKLCSADAVVCPVDCVSHDSCKRVKRICKKYSKPYIMMRGSGLSALAKGLGDIDSVYRDNIM